MSLLAVSTAVEARLAAHWTRCPVRTLNSTEGDTPADNSAFLVVQYPVGSAAQISTGAPGANVFRDEGAIRFVLNVETGEGTLRALTWIDELASLFRGKLFDGVRTDAPSPPVIDDRNDAGGWFSLSFSVPYQHDIFG